VPKHWEVLPALAIYKLKLEKNIGMIEKRVLSLSYGRIVVRPEEKLHGLVPNSFETYQVVDPGDIIVRTTDLQNDKTSLRVGHAGHRGIITSAYMCLKTTDRVKNPFGYQFLNAYDLLKIIYGFGSGLRQNLDFSDIKRMPVLVPPFPEQAAIVRFLDHIDRRIRRYISAKQKMVKLLDEQKQAIIHHALTRGLDPNVRLKPSGVEWLGDVPSHWVIKPLKHWARLNALTLTEGTDPDSEFRYIDIGTVSAGRLVHEPIHMRFRNAPSRARRVLHKGDTIVSTVRTYLKAVWYVEEEADDLIASTGFAVLSPRREVEPAYLGNVLQSKNLIDRVTANSTGIAYPAIPETVLGRFPVALPPTREEQRELVRYIEIESAPINKAGQHAQNEIALLRELRTRLISDVVTGKVDVREVAARLSDEAEEPEPFDEATVLSDTVEETEEGEEMEE
jgi:type I restriction enzyme S subunit